MEDFNYNRSKSHGNGEVMQKERCHGGPPPPPPPSRSNSSQPQIMVSNNKDLKMMKKGKRMSRSSISKPWRLSDDPEFQRKKRVASYKMYSVEGKVKGSFSKSFRWLKDRYWQVVYGWW